MISESTPNNTRCIPYTPATFGPSPVFGGGGAEQPFQSLGYGYGAGGPGAPPAVQQGYGTNYGYGQGAPAIAAQPGAQEAHQMMGPLGPINPVELLAQTDTSFFKNKINNVKLQDGQTEFHIPKEMVIFRFINSVEDRINSDGLCDWSTRFYYQRNSGFDNSWHKNSWTGRGCFI